MRRAHQGNNGGQGDKPPLGSNEAVALPEMSEEAQIKQSLNMIQSLIT